MAWNDLDCNEVLEHMGDWLEGRASDELRLRLEAHLERCEDCRTEQERLSRDSPSGQLTSAGVAHFLKCLEALRLNYLSRTYYVERDLVWTLQERLRVDCPSGLAVFNDFPIRAGNRRSLTVDLALVDRSGRPRLIAEIKYEPSHARAAFGGDIWPTKLRQSAVFWGPEGVAKDVLRVREFVATGLADTGFTLFIDEGGHFRDRAPHEGTEWVDWRYRGDPDRTVSALIGRFEFPQRGESSDEAIA